MERKVSVENFFEQVGSDTCGICAVNAILKMFGKRGLIFTCSSRGVSPKRILHELRKGGLTAVSKTISINNLKPRSILWYPRPLDHYVVVEKITDGWALIYDSAKRAPHWIRLPSLRRKWYKIYGGRLRGWVVEVSDNGTGI